MAWNAEVNAPVGEDFGPTIRAWLAGLVRVGWRVLGSAGDGKIQNEGQTAGKQGALGGFDVGPSDSERWFRLATPRALPHREFLVARVGAGLNWGVSTSTEGYHNADTGRAPVAVDDTTLIKSPGIDLGEGELTAHSIVGDQAEDYSFLFLVCRGHRPVFVFGFDSAVGCPMGERPEDRDREPHYIIAGASASNFFTQMIFQDGLYASVTRKENGKRVSILQPFGLAPVGGQRWFAIDRHGGSGPSLELPNVGLLGNRWPVQFKGFTKGRLLRVSTTRPTRPLVIEAQGERRLNVEGVTFPWHPSAGFLE